MKRTIKFANNSKITIDSSVKLRAFSIDNFPHLEPNDKLAAEAGIPYEWLYPKRKKAKT